MQRYFEEGVGQEAEGLEFLDGLGVEIKLIYFRRVLIELFVLEGIFVVDFEFYFFKLMLLDQKFLVLVLLVKEFV